MIEHIFNNATIDELLDPSKFNELSTYINNLIKVDFPHLIQLLYRIDVSEEKLKQLLKDRPDEDAGKIIATLIIERQIQKLQARKQEKNNTADDVEESW